MKKSYHMSKQFLKPIKNLVVYILITKNNGYSIKNSKNFIKLESNFKIYMFLAIVQFIIAIIVKYIAYYITFP